MGENRELGHSEGDLADNDPAMSNYNRRQHSNIPPHRITRPPRTFDSLWFGTGRIFPEKFSPHPGGTPKSLFYPKTDYYSVPAKRFIHCDFPNTFLVYTDGACLNNGAPNATAGCAFVFGETEQNTKDPTYALFPLENRGPTGEVQRLTSNRAELRAVIAASRFCDWITEGFNTMVIAMDSEYVVEGITTPLRTWISHGWRINTGAPVMNRDLWECLLGEVERWHAYGMKLEFWRIDRRDNSEADYYAGIAASERRLGSFQDIKL
ncbi:hypothetical protein N7540_012831 [Penicillium herquei]|nr:hypothetical protein N7540_012831 [Penicillium herquei]